MSVGRLEAGEEFDIASRLGHRAVGSDHEHRVIVNSNTKSVALPPTYIIIIESPPDGRHYANMAV